MIMNHHLPQGSLAAHADVMIYFKDFVPDHSIERVVPTGHVFLIFELDGYMRHTYDNDTLQPNADYTKVWISGMHKNYISISAHEQSAMFVVQFKPSGAYPFFHQPLKNITEQVVPAENVLGNEVLQLRDDLVKAADATEKFTLAEKWLNDRYKADYEPPSELKQVITELQEQPVSNLNHILDTYPKTQKQLIDSFKKYVGLTPKYYQRILRFNELLQKMQQKEKVSWTDIAYSCGYSDQSHFIKEFRHFSGFNPEEFISKEHDKQANFFPLDRKG